MLISISLISGTTNKLKPLTTTTVSQLISSSGTELGWFMSDSLYDIWNPYTTATNHTRKIIIAKLQAEKYARSDGIGASMLAEKYAKIATEREEDMYRWFFNACDW